MWSDPGSGLFKVRAENYATLRRKIIQPRAMFRTIGMDVLLKQQSLHHVAMRDPNNIVQQLARKAQAMKVDPPFVLVINFVIPIGNFVAYFSSDNPSPATGNAKFDRLMDRFLHGSDEYRSDRLKLIPL